MSNTDICECNDDCNCCGCGINDDGTSNDCGCSYCGDCDMCDPCRIELLEDRGILNARDLPYFSE